MNAYKFSVASCHSPDSDWYYLEAYPLQMELTEKTNNFDIYLRIGNASNSSEGNGIGGVPINLNVSTFW